MGPKSGEPTDDTITAKSFLVDFGAALLTIVYMGSASAKLKPAPAMTTFLYGLYPYTWFPKVRARHSRNAAAVAITAAVSGMASHSISIYIVTLLSNYHPRAVTWPPATTRRHQLASTTRHSLGLRFF